MPSIFPSVAVAALFASAPVWAQSTQVTDGGIAPSAFLGVDLQGDFMAEVPACAAGDDLPSEPCRVATKQADRFEIRGLPYLPISPGYKLFATVDKGAVSELVLTGNANKLYLVKELLTDNLGKPTTSDTQWGKLKSGATYKAETFNWNIQGIEVNFSRDLSDLSRYSVTFSASALEADAGQNDVTTVNDTAHL
ncbi:hypothetical protein IR012_01615 [Pseudomonas putida]|uniref:hypothetical protein n=1 Tax=Pseudomonas putida TaxID=303 RepID=UPI0018A99567|nr:hypothetical protein [Pseudomonas putida]MBF8669036.1 hypothetical protein [Pseudomonas putida]MBF8711005.1 hypothetical protein [Pseudomonas putida]